MPTSRVSPSAQDGIFLRAERHLLNVTCIGVILFVAVYTLVVQV